MRRWKVSAMADERCVYKYEIPFSDVAEVKLPKGAEVLHLRALSGAGGPITMWALVEPDAEMETRTFRIAGTGHGIFDDVSHIDTIYYDIPGSPLVFHVFEIVG